MTIVAVGDLPYSGERMREAITAAAHGRAPITLLVQDAGHVAPVAIDYHDGLRYPRPERTGTGDAGLDRLIASR